MRGIGRDLPGLSVSRRRACHPALGELSFCNGMSAVFSAGAGQGARGGAGTFVFDEIDAGVGGNTARAVGERLRALGDERQVLCITHLPQVASLAETHFTIDKRIEAGQATAQVADVDGDDLVAEIVRIMGGDRDDRTASKHARELLKAA